MNARDAIDEIAEIYESWTAMRRHVDPNDLKNLSRCDAMRIQALAALRDSENAAETSFASPPDAAGNAFPEPAEEERERFTSLRERFAALLEEMREPRDVLAIEPILRATPTPWLWFWRMVPLCVALRRRPGIAAEFTHYGHANLTRFLAKVRGSKDQTQRPQSPSPESLRR